MKATGKVNGNTILIKLDISLTITCPITLKCISIKVPLESVSYLIIEFVDIQRYYLIFSKCFGFAPLVSSACGMSKEPLLILSTFTHMHQLV